jgi:uncharacterized membrane protein (UPF0127 family)
LAACSSGVADLGLGTVEMTVGSETLTVLVADTTAERRQGLRNVDSIPGAADGMLFVYDIPVRAVFGMENVRFPLDIWWFDADGNLLGSAGMNTCLDGDCLDYGSPGPIMWALETAAGEYSFAPGATLSLEE